MDEFSEYDQGNDADAKTIADARFIVTTLQDAWLEGDPIVCAECGGAGGFNEKGERATPEATCFRRIPSQTPDPHPSLCYECGIEMDAREERQRVARRTISDLIPPLFEGKTFKHYEIPPGDPKALALASNFRVARRGGRSLYLHGPPGVGKTHLAMAIAQHAIHGGARTMVLEWSEFTGKLRATFGSKYVGKSEGEIMQDLATADLVVIDDIGHGKFTEWSGEVLWRIVNARHGRQRQVVLTSNLPLELRGAEVDLMRWLGAAGQRTSSRLSSMCEVVQVRGQDVREQMELLPSSSPAAPRT